jgi:hypothetical protein
MYKDEKGFEEALEHFSTSKEIFEELKIVEEVQRINNYIAEIKSAQEEVGISHE